jgi:hypothetical protein
MVSAYSAVPVSSTSNVLMVLMASPFAVPRPSAVGHACVSQEEEEPGTSHNPRTPG